MTSFNLGRTFTCLAMAMVVSLAGVLPADANTKKNNKEKTAQQCKIYTDKIDYQVTIVKKRYNDLINDPLGLYHSYNSKKSKHIDSGSYQGHRVKYEEQRRFLNQYITDALLNGCRKYVSAEADKWSQTPAPLKPNKPK
ncbi:MAG: hypothetical protein Q3971_04100 [Moraxella sp.]|nr:hypothetical protein [Moraxella sp.]